MNIQKIIKESKEEKITEEELRRHKVRYNIMSKIISDYAYSLKVNTGGKLEKRWVLGAFSSFTGYEFSELESLEDWKNIIFLDDRDIVKKHIQIILTGEPDVVEYRIVCKNKNVKWLKDYSYPFFDEKTNKITRIYGAVQDITSFKKVGNENLDLENKYRLIAENDTDGIFCTDEKGILDFVNKAGAKSLGYTVDEMIGQSFFMIVPQKGLDKARNVFKTLSSGDKVRGTLHFQHKNDYMIPTFFSVAPNFRDGKFLGTIGYVKDITNDKKEDVAKIKSQIQLDESKKMQAEYQSRIKECQNRLDSILEEKKKKYPNLDLNDFYDLMDAFIE